MPITNFPGGVASFGIPMIGPGIYDVPPANIWFVCNRAGVVNGDGTSRDKPLASIADAAARISTTTGIQTSSDWIVVLAKHAESVTGSNLFSGSATLSGTAAVFPAGTRIVGEGTGANRPTLTFTAAASTISFVNAGCTVENMRLLCPQSGATTVAAMITTAATDCRIINNWMQMASSATAICTTAIAPAAGSDDLFVSDNTAWGTANGVSTSWLAPSGTVGSNRVQILRNNVQVALNATTNALVDLSANSGTAPTNWLIADNTFANLKAASTVAMLGVASAGGTVAYNQLTILAAGAATAITTPGSWAMIQNFLCQAGKFGILTSAGGAST